MGDAMHGRGSAALRLVLPQRRGMDFFDAALSVHFAQHGGDAGQQRGVFAVPKVIARQHLQRGLEQHHFVEPQLFEQAAIETTVAPAIMPAIIRFKFTIKNTSN